MAAIFMSIVLAVAAGLDDRLVPFVGIYVLTLAVASPILAANAPHFARLVPDRWFPVDAPADAPADQPRS